MFLWTSDCRAGKLDTVCSLAGGDVIASLIVEGEIKHPIDVTVARKHHHVLNFVRDDVVESARLLSECKCRSVYSCAAITIPSILIVSRTRVSGVRNRTATSSRTRGTHSID